MAQLLPVDLLSPIEDEDAVFADQSIEWGQSWRWVFPPCDSCEKQYPHLEVVGQRVVQTHEVETLVQWLSFALATERYDWPIYSTDFGIEFKALTERNASLDEAETEVPRMVREALMIDPRVQQVRTIRIAEAGGSALFLDVEVVTFTADVRRLSVTANLET